MLEEYVNYAFCRNQERCLKSRDAQSDWKKEGVETKLSYRRKIFLQLVKIAKL